MTVIIIEKSPQRLRGIISRYCLEVRSGLFVGRLNGRMRELIWEKIEQIAKHKTRAVMIWRTNNAQGYEFRTRGEDRRNPVQIDGIWLIGESPSDINEPIKVIALPPEPLEPL